ncbi:glycosyltransferase [Arthrobacter sp. Bz4]|uniref:glycosyltransferase n=1 Tax=Arthrobacter sp. Bz4 TaxID=2171979 RepID=UPI001402635A|nr:glycosyltransferase [Arthrobacter sp. Bz4]
MSHLIPRYGIEKVALGVSQMLARHYRVSILSVSGDLPADLNFPSQTLGKSLHGLSRVKSLARIWKSLDRRNSGVFVLVGAWVAIPWLIVAALKRTRSTIIVWEHSITSERFSVSMKWRVLSILAGITYKQAHAVVSVSPPLTQDLERLLPGRTIVTIPNPAECEEDEQTVEANRSVEPKLDGQIGTRFLMVGSLTVMKRHELALRAFSLTPKDAKLTIVGDGPELSRLRVLAANLGIADRVQFAGYLNDAAVHAEMLGHDVLLHCSVAETFGLVFLEAASTHLLVVATKSRTSDYMVPKFVPGLTSESDPQSLLEAMAQVLQPISVELDRERQLARQRRRSAFGSEIVSALWVETIENARIAARLRSGANS